MRRWAWCSCTPPVISMHCSGAPRRSRVRRGRTRCRRKGPCGALIGGAHWARMRQVLRRRLACAGRRAPAWAASGSGRGAQAAPAHEAWRRGQNGLEVQCRWTTRPRAMRRRCRAQAGRRTHCRRCGRRASTVGGAAAGPAQLPRAQLERAARWRTRSRMRSSDG